MRVAFIGLGVMGFPMAGHLASAGLDVTVYNRTTAKAEAWVAANGGQMAPTPAEAAKGAELVFTCVGNDADLTAVVTGADGAVAGMDNDVILIDHTTTSADIARNLSAQLAAQSCHMLDAPVSGGQAGAENGALTIMVGGPSKVFDTVKPILMHYARATRLMGAAGAGQLTKMVNQICIGGLLQSLSEALLFCEKAGLDGRDVVDVISKGAAQSWQMENRGTTMVDDEFEFGFAVDWMRKDLGICFAEAEDNGAELPITRIVDGFYKEVQDMGGGRWDTSSLIRRFRRA